MENPVCGSHRLAVYGVLVFFSGATIFYFVAFERVPITGRRRCSWLPQSKMEEMERVDMEKFKENEEKLVVNSDYPGLRKIEAVLDRLVKASGLDDIAWEVRILDDPSKFML